MNYHHAGFDTLGLVRQFGLPLHLYDGRKIAENLHAFQSAFKDTGINGRVFYAVKSCEFRKSSGLRPRPGRGGCGLGYELATALEASVPRETGHSRQRRSDAYLEQSVAWALIDADTTELTGSRPQPKTAENGSVLLRCRL
jgi:diaminopimelate decarboxylase